MAVRLVPNWETKKSKSNGKEEWILWKKKKNPKEEQIM